MAAEKRTYTTSNFILLTLGRLVSALGSSILHFALSLYVLDLTGKASAFSIIIGLSFLPGIVVNLTAGAFVDRQDKKKIMVWTDILSGLFVLAFFGIFSRFSGKLIFFALYVLVLGTIQSLFTLAVNASIPLLVEKKQVPRLNSAIQAVTSLVTIIGPVMGALLYKTVGIQNIMLINGLFFLCSGISELFIKFRQNKHPGIQRSYFSDVKLTYSYLSTRKIILFLLLFAAIADFILLPFLQVLLPYITYNILQVSGLQLSIIQSACAIGVICAAFLVSLFKDIRPLLTRFFTFFAIQAVLLTAWIFPATPFAGQQNRWLVTVIFSILLLAFGFFNTIQNISMITHFQLTIPEKLRGRIFGVFIATLFISVPPGMWFYGMLLEKFEWYHIISVSGAALLLFGIVASSNKTFKTFIAENREEVNHSAEPAAVQAKGFNRE